MSLIDILTPNYIGYTQMSRNLKNAFKIYTLPNYSILNNKNNKINLKLQQQQKNLIHFYEKNKKLSKKPPKNYLNNFF